MSEQTAAVPDAESQMIQKNKQPSGQAAEDQFANPAVASIAVHPQGVAFAVAVGTELRVLDQRTGKLSLLLAATREGAACVRSIAFDPTGQWLTAGGDDKTFRLWSCQSWECLKTVKGPKKISTVTFSKDGSVMLAADKFGDVLVARTAAEPAAEGTSEVTAAEPAWELLLGHYCSILTSTTLSGDGRFIATTDRDMKVRVSVMPADPMLGAHSIQSYCFGHTSFVTCSAFARAGDKEVLLSGGGDGTLRMWDHITGKMLCMLQLDEAAGEGAEPRSLLAVVTSPDGHHAVVAVDGRNELCAVSLDVAADSMQERGWYMLPGLHLVTDICFDAAGRLWAVGGPPTEASVRALLACGKITADGGLVAAPAASAGLTAEEREMLEARDGSEADVLAEVAARRHSRVAGYLRKRQFSWEDGEERKKKKLGDNS